MLPVTATTDQEGKLCPVRNVLANVTRKWQTLLLLALEDGPMRFGELKRIIGDITQRVLTENLRSMERDGYVTRTVHSGPPLAVTYELTELGKDLVNVMKPLVLWAQDHFERVEEARAMYDG
ncbi:winged helix-turn-helix transcriptional regulator [Ruegeria atlantica]|uniref:winged helix-turn-helix transcriptional regulator n=1 Tax=Ruegeria atlantica TaxID=81569 RepID=UPI002493D635|nr:helix-turn-helix domain-containing protein [Ruegeria atlantica]